MVNDPVINGRAGSMLIESGTAFTNASGAGQGKAGRAIQSIGTADLVINSMTASSGSVDLSGKTIPKGSVVMVSATAISVTSGEAILYFGNAV